MDRMQKTFEKLQGLYDKLPGVPCLAGCKGCCVSPTVTLVEFIYLMDHLLRKLNNEKLTEFITKPMKVHPGFEGNYFCRFQSEQGFCEIHPSRALACRMHGLPVIEDLGVSNLENCTIMDKKFLPKVEKSKATEWLNLLMDLNHSLDNEYGNGIYQLIGLNIECWLDILFIQDLSNPILRRLQIILQENLPHENYKGEYKIHTDIVEKMDVIALLELMMETGEKDGVIKILDKLENEFERTGSFFKKESDWIKNNVNQLE